MIQSMTGFGKATCELKKKVITIEIKTLNSKQIDIYTRLPNIYKEKELDIRNLLSQRLQRGKIECIITYEDTDIANTSRINVPLVKDYYRQMVELLNELEINNNESILQTIMRFPDALKIDKEELDEKEWKAVMQKIHEAILAITNFRKQEGSALQSDITSRIQVILAKLKEIEPFEDDRIKCIRERIESNISEVFEKEKVDQNRFEQELIYYLEKIDITEEKVRLENHCNYFFDVLKENETVGKKLGFITQEIGREINTIGSKANHSEIQKIVVQMKDELEKIKEQLMNVL
ncbi:MAG: YicC family protein [Bacteroidales bacterium]|nr:YicC family protein [Bacteroidales bacterium]